MSDPEDPEARRVRRVATQCADAGISADDQFLVHALLERPKTRWPGCCGSGCQPCMQDIVDIALRVLEEE